MIADAATHGIAVEEARAREVGQVPAGVLHHLDELDPVVLDHRPVDLDHLDGVEVGDSISSNG